MVPSATQRPDRRRRRPALACVNCRRSKIRCDRQVPCSNCAKSKNKTCVLDEFTRPSPGPAPALSAPPRPAAPAPSPDSASRHSRSPDPRCLRPFVPVSVPPSGPATASSTASHDDISSVSAFGPSRASSSVSSFQAETLRSRVSELEKRLANADRAHHHRAWSAHVPVADKSTEVVSSAVTADMHSMPCGIMSKTRYFGHSHWANAGLLYKSIFDVFHHEVFKTVDSEAIHLLAMCKNFGRRIKSDRVPTLSSPTPTDDLPPRHVADQLIDGYLRISESIYRILHVPSFRASYEQVWAAKDTTDPAFMIQLHLVMAIGSVVLDDQFSMRKSAVRWIFEAQWWMIAPSFKKRLTVVDLQNMILLCVAREIVGVDGDLVWISLGSVLRMAMQMGYHRDPSKLPPVDQYQAEMRRRLWATILELVVHTSLSSGSPALLSLSDFDTEPPADVNDTDLSAGKGPVPLPREAGIYTDMTLPLALRATLPVRLAICHFLNDLGSASQYKKTIELHESLVVAYKSTARRLAAAEAASNQKLTLFQRQMFDIMASRYFLALHIPHQEMAMREPAYAFSKTTILDHALKAYLAYCPSSVYSCLNSGKLWSEDVIPNTSGDTDLSRLAFLAAGSFRWFPIYAAILVGLDMQNQLREEAVFSLVPPRPDLLDVVDTVRAWALRRVKAGDTNVKGYLFTTAQCIMIQGLVAGQKYQETYRTVLEVATDAIRTATGVLEEQAGQILPEQGDASWDSMQASTDGTMPMDEDWEGMGGFFFDLLGLESISQTRDIGGLMAPSQSWI